MGRAEGQQGNASQSGVESRDKNDGDTDDDGPELQPNMNRPQMVYEVSESDNSEGEV